MKGKREIIIQHGLEEYRLKITASGKLVEGPSVLFELSDLIRGYLWQAGRALGGDVASVAVDSIYDHSPLLYVRCLRQCSIPGQSRPPAIDYRRWGSAQRETG